MTYFVLNCRDLEHRDKAVKRLEATGRRFCSEPSSDAELQIWMLYDGELSFDKINPDEVGLAVFTKIKAFIIAIDARKPLTKE